jgi:DNA-directed RNA polymerase subunit beta'
VQTTVGQLLINDALPEDMRDHERVLDKKGVTALLRELAERHPDKYKEVSHKLSQIGWRASQETGGFSFGLEHLRKSKAALAIRQRLTARLDKILSNEKLTDEQREELIVKHVGRELEKQKSSIYEESLAAENPLAKQVLSGSRGNPMNLSSLLGSDLLYTDQRDRVIPVPVLRSYSEGLSPAEYWAGTYGARKGVMATKFATQESGFLSKQLNQVAHRLVVEDEDEEEERQKKGLRGVPADTDDPDNEGALLAHDIGGYKRNTPLTPKILNNLRRNGVERILVRSPIVGGSSTGGLYARDVGVRERGRLPGRGENVGLAAAQALSEPLSQAQLSAKHTGGVIGEEKAVSGFNYIKQLIQVPKKFKGGAAHAQHDGRVTRIDEAPAGGLHIYINGKQHFVGAGYDAEVKRGQEIEAGDVISEGIPNPAEIVKHKGVGEGRRYFAHSFRQAMQEAGIGVNRRNVELLSRGLINHLMT